MATLLTSPSEQDHYKALNIAIDATAQQIRRAFRILALKCHPDKTDDSQAKKDAAQFRSIRAAHDVLVDDLEREKYNQRYPVLKAEWERFEKSDSSSGGESETPSDAPTSSKPSPTKYQAYAEDEEDSDDDTGDDRGAAARASQSHFWDQPSDSNAGATTGAYRTEMICRRVVYTYKLCGHAEAAAPLLGHFFACAVKLRSQGCDCSYTRDATEELAGWCPYCLLDTSKFITQDMKRLLVAARMGIRR